MKLETIKRNNKKNIIIGSMIALSMVGCLTLTTTRAKYRNVQSIKLANGTVRYIASDLQIVAIKISDDGETYTDTAQVPTSSYTLNSQSKCTINGKDDASITITYDSGIVAFSSLKKGAKCNLYFDRALSPSEKTLAKLSIINVKTAEPDFSKIATKAENILEDDGTDNNGIFEADDSMYATTENPNPKSYYWRGAATTNHVIFDDKCWRIVRINGERIV